MYLLYTVALNIYSLFMCLCRVLVAACRIFCSAIWVLSWQCADSVVVVRGLHCSMARGILDLRS